jgi:hypothetical protein
MKAGCPKAVDRPRRMARRPEPVPSPLSRANDKVVALVSNDLCGLCHWPCAAAWHKMSLFFRGNPSGFGVHEVGNPLESGRLCVVAEGGTWMT